MANFASIGESLVSFDVEKVIFSFFNDMSHVLAVLVRDQVCNALSATFKFLTNKILFGSFIFLFLFLGMEAHRSLAFLTRL